MRQPTINRISNALNNYGEPEGQRLESHANARLCRLLLTGRKNFDAEGLRRSQLFPRLRRGNTGRGGAPLGKGVGGFRKKPFASFRKEEGHWYWLTLLFSSQISMSLLNASTRSGLSVPAFLSFLLAFTQFSISCSSIRCLLGFRLFSSMKPFTSSYRFCQRSSCVIFLFCMLRCHRNLSSSPFPTIHRRLHLRLVLSGFAAEEVSSIASRFYRVYSPPSRPGCQESMPTHGLHQKRCHSHLSKRADY